MEVSFFVTEDALIRIQPNMRFDEAGLPRVFDAHRNLIYAAAAKVYMSSMPHCRVRQGRQIPLAMRSLSNRMKPQTRASASTPWSLRLSVREALKSLPVPTEVAYPSTINNTVQPLPVCRTQASR
jgi:hypothetical protein